MSDLDALHDSLGQLAARLREHDPGCPEIFEGIEDNAVFVAWGMYARRLDVVARQAAAPKEVSVRVRRLLEQTLAHAPIDARTLMSGLMACRAVRPPDLALLGVRVMPFAWGRVLRFVVVMAAMAAVVVVSEGMRRAAVRVAEGLATSDITLPLVSVLALVPAVYLMLVEHDKRRLWGAMLAYAREVAESLDPVGQAVVTLGRNVIGGGTRLLKRVAATCVALGFVVLLTRVFGWDALVSPMWMLSTMLAAILVYQVVLFFMDSPPSTNSRDFRNTLEQVERWSARTIENYARTPGLAGEEENS